MQIARNDDRNDGEMLTYLFSANARFTHLIIVLGHAVYIGNSPTDAYDGTKWEGTYAGYKYNDKEFNYLKRRATVV